MKLCHGRSNITSALTRGAFCYPSDVQVYAKALRVAAHPRRSEERSWLVSSPAARRSQQRMLHIYVDRASSLHIGSSTP